MAVNTIESKVLAFPITLQVRYALPGTNIRYPDQFRCNASALRLCHAMSGTEIHHAATGGAAHDASDCTC
eukprot:2950919-Rhodomonas_salina.1